MAGVADGGKFRALRGASVFHAFSGQHPLVLGIGPRAGRHVPVALGVCHVWLPPCRGGTEEMLSSHVQTSFGFSVTFHGRLDPLARHDGKSMIGCMFAMAAYPEFPYSSPFSTFSRMSAVGLKANLHV